jgi:thioredoxin 1
VLHADSDSFERLVLQAETPVLVDFYAEWCVPCKALAPVLDELVVETPQARVVKVNIDDCPEIAARYKVESVPSLLVFEGGLVIAQHTGLTSKSRLKSLLGL